MVASEVLWAEMGWLKYTSDTGISFIEHRRPNRVKTIAILR